MGLAIAAATIALAVAATDTAGADGRLAAYGPTETDWEQDAYVRHIWLADTGKLEHGKARELLQLGLQVAP